MKTWIVLLLATLNLTAQQMPPPSKDGTDFGTLLVKHRAGLPVKPLDYSQLGTIFLSGSFINTLLFLKQSPLPPDNGDTTTIQKP